MPLVPLARYPVPRYPTRVEIRADRDLLLRHVPPAWRMVPGMGTILALFLAAEAGAAETPAGQAAPGAGAIVAPLFRHGEGRGSFGCVAVAAPVFLSEEEAMAVISEELGRRGVALTQRNQVWEDARIAPRRAEMLIPKGVDAGKLSWDEETRLIRPVDVAGKAAPLEVDGIDPAKHIAVEFVSNQEYESLGGYDPHRVNVRYEADPDRLSSRMSTVSSTNLGDAAEHVAESVRRTHVAKDYFAAFYDPMARMDWRSIKVPEDLPKEQREAAWKEVRAKAEAAAKEQSLAQLRLQVRDFIAWLEGQGAL